MAEASPFEPLATRVPPPSRTPSTSRASSRAGLRRVRVRRQIRRYARPRGLYSTGARAGTHGASGGGPSVRSSPTPPPRRGCFDRPAWTGSTGRAPRPRWSSRPSRRGRAMTIDTKHWWCSRAPLSRGWLGRSLRPAGLPDLDYRPGPEGRDRHGTPVCPDLPGYAPAGQDVPRGGVFRQSVPGSP